MQQMARRKGRRNRTKVEVVKNFEEDDSELEEEGEEEQGSWTIQCNASERNTEGGQSTR